MTDDLEGLTSSVRKFVVDTAGIALVTPGCLLDTTNVGKATTAQVDSAPGGGLKNTKGVAVAGKGNSNKVGKSVDGNKGDMQNMSVCMPFVRLFIIR